MAPAVSKQGLDGVNTGAADLPVSRVYLETNSLRGRWPTVIGELRILATLAQLVSVDVYIPSSALVEHEHSSIRQLQDHIRTIERSVRDVHIVSGGLFRKPESASLDVDSFRESYRRAVKAASDLYSFKICDTSSKSLEYFIERSARGWAPFKAEDQGFRDAVHLQSVIEHLQQQPIPAGSMALLVTGDGRLSKDDVKELVRQSDVPLRIVPTMQIAIDAVNAHLSKGTKLQLAHLVRSWRPAVMDFVKKVIPDAVVARVKEVFVTPTHYIRSVHRISNFQWEHGTGSIAPKKGAPDRTFVLTFEARLDARCLTRQSRDGVVFVDADELARFILSADATISASSDFQIQHLEFDRAYLFGVWWRESEQTPPGRWEALTPPVELFDVSEDSAGAQS